MPDGPVRTTTAPWHRSGAPVSRKGPVGADATALLVAHAKGYFEEAGLKVAEPTPVRS